MSEITYLSDSSSSSEKKKKKKHKKKKDKKKKDKKKEVTTLSSVSGLRATSNKDDKYNDVFETINSIPLSSIKSVSSEN